MIHSMTGYGRAVETVNGREITVELRSVNNRFLDCNVKIPRAFSYAEEAVKQEIKKNVSRGKLDVYIGINSVDCQDVSISVNRPVLEGYLQALQYHATDGGRSALPGSAFTESDDRELCGESRSPEQYHSGRISRSSHQ